MNIFKNKFLFKLIVLICLCLTMFTIGSSNKVYSANKDNNEVWGSILITPVIQLITGIGDGIIDIIHQVTLKQQVSLVKIDGSPEWWARHGKVIVGILIAIAIAVVAWYVAGAVITGLVAKGVFTMTGLWVCTIAEIAIGAGAVGGFLIVERIEHTVFPQDLYLPVYNITPQQIFANEIPLFDINFFEPMESKQREEDMLIPGGSIKYTGNLKTWESLAKYAYPWKPETESEKERSVLKCQDWEGIMHHMLTQ